MILSQAVKAPAANTLFASSISASSVPTRPSVRTSSPVSVLKTKRTDPTKSAQVVEITPSFVGIAG
jgi:hypothetical protein